MAGEAENLNMHVLKNQRLKWCIGGNNFPLSDYRTTVELLLRNYQATLPLRCGNFILTATVVRSQSAWTFLLICKCTLSFFYAKMTALNHKCRPTYFSLKHNHNCNTHIRIANYYNHAHYKHIQDLLFHDNSYSVCVNTFTNCGTSKFDIIRKRFR